MSGLYDSYKELCGSAGTSPATYSAVDWLTDNIGVMLINYANYIPTIYGTEALALATDVSVADVAAHANVEHRRLLATDLDEVGGVLGATLLPAVGGGAPPRYVTGGVQDAGDIVFQTVVSVPAADPIGGLILYKVGAGDATSPLIALVNFGVTVLPNGGDIKVQWGNTAGVLVYAL